MQDVEEHHVIDGGIGKPGAARNDISCVCLHISYSLGVRPCPGRRHHGRIDVQGIDRAAHDLGGRDGESAVAAPKVQTTKPGKFEQADTGTVFLDEIGDVPAAIQVKLLRVLQEREFERLGSNVTRHIDIRLVAATNQDLRAALEQGTFREDLYYRLNVVPLNIPPLRERKVDIPSLANHFVHKLAPETGCRVEAITDAAMDKLVAYHWPGNVRELENVIERSLVDR